MTFFLFEKYYYFFGDYMKKYYGPVFFSLIIGVFMAYLVISQYDSYDGLTVSGTADRVYFIQSGVYSVKSNMENDMNKFSSYIYSVEDNMYYSYVGISSIKENAERVKKYYEKMGYDMVIKEKIVDNSKFIKILKQYDIVLSDTSDDESIKVICAQILSKYEEYVNGKRKN